MEIVEPYLAWTEPQIFEIYSVLKGSIRFYSVNGQDHNSKVLLQNQEQGSSHHLAFSFGTAHFPVNWAGLAAPNILYA
ncbi:unnamed protein product [Urochloa humidicola]